MIFWMDSKTFQDVFLENEDDGDILKAQYVIVSSRIRMRHSLPNVISAFSFLYPDIKVFGAHDTETYEDLYYQQLAANDVFLANVIVYSIKDKKNIIFLCAKNEKKQRYLKYLEYYIQYRFKFPIYDYKMFSQGMLPIESYNEKKVLKICDKIIKEAKKKKKNAKHKQKFFTELSKISNKK